MADTQEKELLFNYPEPRALELERNIIGWLILGNQEQDIISILDIVEEKDFFYREHQIVYEVVKDLVKNGKPVDVIAVSDKISKIGYSDLLPASDLVSMTNDLVTYNLTSIKNYAKEVHQTGLLRRAMKFFEEKTKLASKRPEDIIKFLAEAEGEFLDIIDVLKPDRPTDVKGILHEVEESIKENMERGFVGHNTGFKKLDEEYGGLIPGQTWVFGAYVGTGKTLFSIQICINVLKKGGHVAFFSTEMDREAIMLRFLGNLAGISPLVIMRGGLTPEEEEQVEKAKKKILKFGERLQIYDNAYTVDEIRLKCKKQKLYSGLDVFVLDFVQNLRGGGTLYERMSEAAVELQALAKEVDSTALIMSQVSNEGKSKEGATDVISFKGAGELAAIADLGLWLTKVKDTTNKLELQIRKSRHSVTGLKVYIDALYTQGGRMRQGVKPDKNSGGDDPFDAENL